MNWVLGLQRQREHQSQREVPNNNHGFRVTSSMIAPDFDRFS
jgi:hypothetical protein